MKKNKVERFIGFIILTAAIAVSYAALPVMSIDTADTNKYTYTESKALADYGLSQWSTEYFSNGLMKVRKGGMGFIDETGKEVIPCVYKYAGSFIGDGKYTVASKETEDSIVKAGVIDRKGNIILPFEYDTFLSPYSEEWNSAGIFNEYGYILAKKGKYGIVDRKHKIIVPFEYLNISRFQNGLAYGVRGDNLYSNGEREIDIIDEKGSIIRTIEANYIDEFNGELALISNKGVFGLINKDYEVVLPIEYDYISNPADGYYIVKKDGKLGAVDAVTGEIVMPVEYGCAPGSDHNWEIEFSEGLIVFNKGGYWYENEGQAGAIDITGKTVIPFEYTALGAFKNGVAFAYKDSETLGFIDKENNTVIPFEYESMGYVLDDGYIVRRGGKTVYIDKTGKEIFETEYGLQKFDWEDKDPDYFMVSAYKEALDINGNVYGRDYKYGVIDKTGKTIIPFISSHERIQKTGEYFIYTTNYEYDPKANYNSFYSIYNKKGEKIGESVKYPVYYSEHNVFLIITDRYDYKAPAYIIDGKGKPLFSPNYDICTAYSSKYDVFVVGKKDKNGSIKYGVADKSGDILIPLEYELISFTGGTGNRNHYDITPPDVFHDGGYAMIQKDGKFGYIHISGEIVVPCEYDRFINYNEGFVIAQKGKHTDINKPSPVKWHILELISSPISDLRGEK